MKKGYSYSALMHVFLLLLAYLGLPQWFQKEMEPQPFVITLENLPISETSNVKPSDKPLAPKHEKQPPKTNTPTPPKPVPTPPPPPPAPPPAPVPVSQPKPTPPAPKPPVSKPPVPKPPIPKPPVPKPVVKEPEIKRPDPIKNVTRPKEIEKPKTKTEKPVEKPIEKPQPPKKQTPKTQTKQTPKPSETKESSDEESMEDILKNIEKQAQETDEDKNKPIDPNATASNKTKSPASYDASRPLSMSVQDSIRSQLQPCWVLPAGAQNPESLVVTVHVRLNRDGSVNGTPTYDPTHAARYRSDEVFRSAVDKAIRAVKNPRCSPLKGLPAESYESWKNLRFTFDPKEALAAWGN